MKQKLLQLKMLQQIVLFPNFYVTRLFINYHGIIDSIYCFFIKYQAMSFLPYHYNISKFKISYKM